MPTLTWVPLTWVPLTWVPLPKAVWPIVFRRVVLVPRVAVGSAEEQQPFPLGFEADAFDRSRTRQVGRRLLTPSSG
ncbi:MAG TPA: hypothetical protein VGJ20_30400 [Xanthobacteraceae bacterium]